MGNRLIAAGFSSVDYANIPQDRPVIRLFDDAGNLLKSINSGPDFWYPTALAMDTKGRIYAAMYNPITGAAEFRKYHRDGQRLATAIAHGARVNQIHVDSSGNVFLTGEPVNASGHVWSYAGGDAWPRSGYYTTRKFSAAETELWKIDNGIGSYAALSGRFCVDSSGDVVIALPDTGGVTKGLRKFSGSTGALSWEYTYAWTAYYEPFYNVATDSANNVYAIGSASGDPDPAFIYKLTSGGSLSAVSAKISGINGSYYRFDTSDVLHCISTLYVTVNTSLVASAAIDIPDYAGTVGPCSRDTSGSLYVGLPAPSGYVSFASTYPQLDKYNASTTTVLWSFENFHPLPKTIDGSWAGCTCLTIIENPELPALPIPLGFGVPTIIGDRYTAVLGLPMPFALRAPTWLREFAGAYPPATIYRLYLTGGTGTIELPLSSFSCRRGNGQLTLSAVCPALTLSQLTAIEARTAGDVIVKSGPKFVDGTEQLEEMLRAPFSSLRWDSGSGSASGTIEAKATALAANPKTRTLRGISYRNAINGLRRVRCAVDVYLAPGDTADLGAGETLIVSEISYQVSPEQAVMEVAEDGT
jgi:hypothetical protein